MNNTYKEYSFLELITANEIEIPIIQRDYAQGRISAKANEIRENFLSALIESLRSAPEGKKMILDFVYGSTATTPQKKLFIPLDGQQRLTTLFLLHWYLCPGDELFCLQKEGLSGFSYQTRISSKDFCHKLVVSGRASIESSIEKEKKRINEEIKKEESRKEINKEDLSEKIKELKEKLVSWNFRKAIVNEPWFMWSWQKDPTVKAMLVMLKAIHEKLGELSGEEKATMWHNLKQGQVAFHLLPLEEFGLTDELYVKMNARGKELSAFDIFKSTLEEQMRLKGVEESIQEEWRNKVDSCWIDIFWNKIKPRLEKNNSTTKEENYKKRKEIVDSVEDGYLMFMKRMMVFHLFRNDPEYKDEHTKFLPWKAEEGETIRLEQIRDYSVRNDILNLMPFLIRIKFFDESFFRFMIQSMDSLIYEDESGRRRDASELIGGLTFEIEDKTIFGEFINPKITYEARIQFYGLLLFLNDNPAQTIYRDEEVLKQLKEWMRIIRNLSTNTNVYSFNTSADFGRALQALQKWATDIYKNKLYPSITALMADNIKLDGFAGFQLEEEQVKARLCSAEEWREQIENAEEHPYFLGQIPFLLRWSEEEDGLYNIGKFKEYSRKMSAIFEKGGLRSELRHPDSHIFRNAMMCAHKYYLRGNSLVNSEDKSRDNSWKRYLRDETVSDKVKVLLDQWNEDKYPSFVEFCHDFIACNAPTDWRKYFIEYPCIYNEMYDHCIGIWNEESEEIALLSKTRWSSRHKELKTYYWSLRFGTGLYYHSHTPDFPYCGVIGKNPEDNRGLEFTVEYIPENHEYVVGANFDPEMEDMEFSTESQWWEAWFLCTETDKVEALLEKLKVKLHQL